MEDEWESVRALLLSDKVTIRRDGVKRLNLLLDSDEFLKTLDTCTVQIWSQDRVPGTHPDSWEVQNNVICIMTAASWPGVCSDLMKFLTQQVEGSMDKKKGPEESLGKLLKRFVRLAEDKTRTGRRLMLRRRIRRLFEHIARILSTVKPESQIAADYRSVLRVHLLPCPEYCLESQTSTFEELMDFELSNVENIPLGKREESYGALSTVQLLLQNFPGHVPEVLQRDLMFFFTDQVRQMQEIRDVPKVAIALLTCINGFLAHVGLDVSGPATQLHAAIHPFIKSNWLTIRSTKLKETLVSYMRIQLQIGGIQATGNGLSDLYQVLERELQEWGMNRVESINSLCWLGVSSSTSWKLTKDQHSFAALVASIIFHSAKTKHQLSVGDPTSLAIVVVAPPDLEDGMRRKRQKSTNALEELFDNFIANPGVWGPVLVALYEHHADCLDPDVHQRCLLVLVDAAEMLLKMDVFPVNLGGSISLVRVGHIVAQFWDVVNLNGGATENKWKTLEQCIMKFPGTDSDLQDEVLQLLAIMYGRRLVPVLGLGGSKYCNGLFESTPLLEGTVGILPALISDASHKSHNYKLYMDICLRAISSDSPVELDVIFRALSSILNRSVEPCKPGHRDAVCYHKKWVVWDKESVQFEKEIDSLQHGAVKLRSLAYWKQKSGDSPFSQMVPDNMIGILQQAGAQRLSGMFEGLAAKGESESAVPCLDLLRTCCVAVEFLRIVHEGHRASVAAGQLALLKVELGNSLQRAGHHVCKAIELADPEIESVTALAAMLICSVGRYDSALGTRFSENFASWIAPFEDYFLAHYSSVIVGGERLSESLGASEDLFDSELDMGVTRRVHTGSSHGGAATLGTSEDAIGRLVACLKMLGNLAEHIADESKGCLDRITNHVNSIEASPPEELCHALVRTACILGGLVKGEPLAKACDALEAELDLVPPGRFHNPRIAFVVEQIWTVMMSSRPGRRMSMGDAEAWGRGTLEWCAAETVDDEVFSAVGETMKRVVGIFEDVVKVNGCSVKSDLRLKLASLAVAFAVKDRARYGSVVEKMALALVQDPHPAHNVRSSCIPLVCKLLAKWRKRHTFFEDLRLAIIQQMPSETDGSEFIAMQSPQFETEIEFLVGCAVTCQDLERDSLVMLCVHAALYPSNLNLVQHALDLISISLGYPSRGAYIRVHRTELVIGWFSDARTLEQFLTLKELIDLEDSGEFLEPYKLALVTSLVLDNQDATVGVVAEMLGQNVRSLLEESLPNIRGVLRVSLVCGSQKDRDVAHWVEEQGMLAKVFSRVDLARHLSENLLDVLEVLLLMSLNCSDDVGPQGARYPKGWIVRAVQAVLAEQGEGFRLSGGQVCWLLLRIHGSLNEAIHPRHKVQYLAAVMSIVEVLGDGVCDDAAFRYLVHILLLQLDTPELQGSVCSILTKVLGSKIQAAQSNREHFRALGDSFHPLVSKIVECLENSIHGGEAATSRNRSGTLGGSILSTDSQALRTPFSPPPPTTKKSQNVKFLMDLLGLLVDQPELHEALSEVEPFPNMPEFDKAREARDYLCRGVKFQEQLSLFVRRVPHMTETMRLRAVLHLRHSLRSSREKIYESACKGTLPRDLTRCAWKLVSMVSDLDSKDVSNLTGELLGVLGPFDPYTITLRTKHSGNRFSRPIAHLLEGNRPGKQLTSLDLLMPDVLRYLFETLLDRDVKAIQCTQMMVCKLLSPGNSHSLLHEDQKDDQGWMKYLKVYERVELPEKCEKEVFRASHLKNGLGSFEGNDFWETAASDYEGWVCTLAASLLNLVENPILKILRDLASMKTGFAELIMPFIFQDLALGSLDQSHVQQILSAKISLFVLKRASTAQRASQLVLSCLEFLRHCHRDWMASGFAGRKSIGYCVTPEGWSKVYWLDVDYMEVALAAFQCSAYFTSLVYVEHWCEDSCGGLTLPEAHMNDLDQETLPVVDGLLLDIYRSVSEPDGLYAVARTPHIKSQLTLLEHEGNWEYAATLYDLALSTEASPSNEMNLGLLSALRHLGWNSTLRGRLEHLKTTGIWHDDFSDIESELAWRMSSWDSREKEGEVSEVGGLSSFHGLLHGALSNLRDGDREGFLLDVKNARCGTVECLSSAATESLAALNPSLVKLQMIDMVSEGWRLRWPKSEAAKNSGPRNPFRSSLSEPSGNSSGWSNSLQAYEPEEPEDSTLDNLEKVWEMREELAGSEGRFDLMDGLLAVHGALLKCLGRKDRLPKLLMRTEVSARKVGNLAAARRGLEDLRAAVLREKKAGISRDTRPDAAWRLEEGKLLWLRGEKTVAVQLGKSIIQKVKSMGVEGDKEALAQWLCLLGGWLAETKAEPAAEVMKLMMEAAQAVTQDSTHGEGPYSGAVACKVLYRLANFADRRYQGIQHQKSSQEWLTSKAVIEKKREQMSVLKNRLHQAGNHEMKRALNINIEKLRRPIDADEQMAKVLENDEARFLQIALKNYRRCLVAGHQHDLPVVSRLCQLWFLLSQNPSANKEVREAFRQAPSYKFLPLVYQIASRMSAAGNGADFDSGFQSTLNDLMVRMAVDHPYHVLYLVFALKNGNLGSDGQVQKGPVSMVMSRDVDMDKVLAATQLLQHLSHHVKLKDIVSQMSKMVEAYITLAAAKDPKGSNSSTMVFPSSIQRQVQDLPLVPVVSKQLDVQRDGNYQFSHFRAFGRTIKFVGGINKPKLIACEDSEGTKHRELVKSGNDDLRQDAVMQQFFELVNSLLRECSATRKRQLNIVTYKVVPFSPGAGLLEWVEHTLPLSDYLLGADKRGGAHIRYKRPKDYTFVQCFQQMNSTSKRHDLRKKFENVCDHFKPVLHHFFLERYRDPASWFEKRLAYTRSTAVNSIAGYIIGLGDRHSSNILIKGSTAEVVHIDLGIAFEQGRFLNIPEMVPFRLTRDIVDGMGINGVEGAMRRCCEETIRVLRENREALVTIVEVLIHDPLYKWGMTPIKAQRRQRQDSCLGGNQGNSGGDLCEDGAAVAGRGNADAERSILRVKQKLEGTESGEPRGVEGQVQQLIQDAQDCDKLSGMFVGWAAWL